MPVLKGFYDVALRKEAERRAEAEEEYQVISRFDPIDANGLHPDHRNNGHSSVRRRRKTKRSISSVGVGLVVLIAVVAVVLLW